RREWGTREVQVRRGHPPAKGGNTSTTASSPRAVSGPAATPSTRSEHFVSTRSRASPCRSTIRARNSAILLAARDSPCRPAASAAAAKYRTSVTTPPLPGQAPVNRSAPSLPESPLERLALH